MLRLLIRWAINSALIVAMLYVLPYVEVTAAYAAIITGLVLGFLNTMLRPAFVALSLPLKWFTLGISVLVVNGVVLKILAWILGDRLDIGGILWTIVATVIISLVTTIVNIAVGDDESGLRGTEGA